MAITAEQEAAYLANGGITCPSCHADDIECGSIEVDNGGAFQEVYCLHCDACWTDVYTLSGIIPCDEV